MGLKTSQQLKSLQTRLAKAEIKLAGLDVERREAAKNHAAEERKVAALREEIQKIKQSELIVSEHAILRFMERAMCCDTEQIKAKILSDSVIEMAKTLGNGKYPINEGLKAVVRDGVVVSVI